MAFFKSKAKSILGVDVGAGGIKLVEFAHVKGRPQLHTYAFFDRKLKDVGGANLIDDTKTCAALVRRMMKKARTTTIRAVAGLPAASVFSSIIFVPASEGKELYRAIEWQARKLIPLPLEEMVLDWKILDGAKKKEMAGSRGLIPQADKKQIFQKPAPSGPPELGGKESMRILLTGAAKKLVGKYVDLAREAGLELLALETEIFALIRSLVGKDPSRILIVDFGSMRTSLIVVEAGVPVLTRSITLGGLSVTRAIAKTLGVPEEQADEMKRDLEGLGKEANGPPQALVRILEPLITEIKYALGLYQKQQGGGGRVEKIVLTGGSAHLPGLAGFISGAVELNTYVGDPWARVAAHEDLRPVLDEIGPRFAVVVGLGMRDFE